MHDKFISLTPRLHEYLLEVSLREPEILARLRKETSGHPRAVMQIAPEQGQLMAFLVRLIGARRAVEVGVFTGYSSLAVALALPSDGRLVACDVSEEWTSVARRYWAEAGVADRVDLRLGPALETLAEIFRESGADSFDMGFIDADKGNYAAYLESLWKLVRPGGLILLDNTLWDGKVVDPQADDPDTRAIRALNLSLRDDPRFDLVLLPVADGLTLLRKRPL